MTARNVFITGATGYIGSRLVPRLLARGHTVRALVRPQSVHKLPRDAEAIIGSALDGATFAGRIAPSDTFVQLVGVPHPSPSKAEEFRRIDLASVRASAEAAKGAGIGHFVYLSVAQPAPLMRDYIAVREEGERLVREMAMPATFLRPWYVLGPGHRWPYAILPFYWLWMIPPRSRDTARRLYPVTLSQVLHAMVDAVEHPPDTLRIIEAPEMRRAV